MRISSALSAPLLLGVLYRRLLGLPNLADPASALSASPSYITRVRVTLRNGSGSR